MNKLFKTMQIKRFLIIYTLLFTFVAPIIITLSAYFFGTISIQGMYLENYTNAAFQEFDDNFDMLLSNNSTVLFNIVTYNTLQEVLSDRTLSVEEKNKQVQSLLSSLLKSHKQIRQIDIISDTSEIYTYVSTGQGGSSIPIPIPESNFMDNLEQNKLRIYDKCLYEVDTNNPCIVLGQKFIDPMTNFSYGKIIMYINENHIRNLYKSNFMKNSIIYVSCNDKILSCSDSEYIGTKAFLSLKSKKGIFSESSHTYIHKANLPILRESIEITYILSKYDMQRLTHRLNYMLTLSIILISITSITLTLLLSKNLLKNLNTLKSQVKLISNDYTQNFQVNPKSEITELELQFVKMSEKIKNLISTINYEQEQKRIAELRALQNQIDPHFVYNSIDALSWMAKLHKPYDDIEKISCYLGQFFRLGLHKGENIVSISDELNHVKSYIEIEKIRFPDKFDVFINVDENIFNYNVIKIILQPLVENSIKHGFKNLDKKGIINIDINIDSNYPEFVTFRVSDNGVGMSSASSELPEGKSTNSSYALKNVNERLIIEYGKESALNFSSELNCGTVVTFKILRSLMNPQEKQES